MLLLRQQVGLVLCFVECLLFGGSLYGWPSLVYVLKDDGVYAHLCGVAGGVGSGETSSSSTSQQLHQQPPPVLHGQNDTGKLVSSFAPKAPAYGHTNVYSTSSSAANARSSANVTVVLNVTQQGKPSDHIGDRNKEIRSHIKSLGCGSQDTHLALAVILAVLMQGLSALPTGRLFDRYGLRVTRTLATVCGFVGFNVLAFVEDGLTSWLVYPGCIFIGIAQNAIMMTNCYVTELAGSKASTLVAIYNGAMLASSGVLLMIKIGYDHGVPRTTSVTILGGLWIISIVNTFTFLPKRKILRPSRSFNTTTASSPDTELSSAMPYVTSTEDQPQADINPNVDCNTADDVSSNYVPAYELSWTRGLLASEPSESEFEMAEMQTPDSPESARPEVINKPADEERRWRMHIRSSLFISYLYWFCALHFRVNVFISTFSLWVRMVVEEDKERESYFTNVYGYMNIAGIVLSPLPGMIIDYRRRNLARNERFGLLGAMAACPALTFSTAVALVMGMTSLLKFEAAIYLSTVLCVVLRACVYPTGTAFIGLVWPTRVYGTLFGMTFTMLGAVAFLQYPFVIWASTLHRGNVSMNALLLFLTVLSFLLPGHVLFKYRKRKERNAAEPVPAAAER